MECRSKQTSAAQQPASRTQAFQYGRKCMGLCTNYRFVNATQQVGKGSDSWVDLLSCSGSSRDGTVHVFLEDDPSELRECCCVRVFGTLHPMPCMPNVEGKLLTSDGCRPPQLESISVGEEIEMSMRTSTCFLTAAVRKGGMYHIIVSRRALQAGSVFKFQDLDAGTILDSVKTASWSDALNVHFAKRRH